MRGEEGLVSGKKVGTSRGMTCLPFSSAEKRRFLSSFFCKQLLSCENEDNLLSLLKHEVTDTPTLFLLDITKNGTRGGTLHIGVA